MLSAAKSYDEFIQTQHWNPGGENRTLQVGTSCPVCPYKVSRPNHLDEYFLVLVNVQE